MHSIKKIFVTLLAATAVLQGLALPVSAAGSRVTGHDPEEKTAFIDILPKMPEKSDFLDSFPDIKMEKEKVNLRPSAELANQKRKDYVSIPLYFQTDYPDALYGNGTVESSGCSITSIAMIATYLTGYEYLPDELAYYFGGRAESNIARLELAAETLGLPYEKPENWHYTLAELKEGKCAIILVDSQSDFTGTQHFIVLTGLAGAEQPETPEENPEETTPEETASTEPVETIQPETPSEPAETEQTEPPAETAEPTAPEEEKTVRILVNDPYAPNYQAWDLLEGFENGFEESDIIKGYQGAWVFDKSAMPKEITRYFEPEPVPVDDRYWDIELSLAERQLLARVIWAEARGESPEGQQAVAEVVLNRILSDNFPEDVRDIVYQEGQFRTLGQLMKAQPGQAQYEAIEDAFYGPHVIPEDVMYFARFETNSNVWGKIGNHIFCYEEKEKAGK